MAASQNGHVEVVDKLLQHGATLDTQYQVHNTQDEHFCNIFYKQYTLEFEIMTT